MRFASTISLVSIVVGSAAFSQPIDLASALVVVQGDDQVLNTARRVLVEETAKRTGITLKTPPTPSPSDAPVIRLTTAIAGPALALDLGVPEKAESYAITVRKENGRPTIALVGRDGPGVLYAVGRLLLAMELHDGTIHLPADFTAVSAPRYPHRGHQIAFRALAHCFDAWTPADYEQYMRELAIFGANAFETTSYGSGADRPSPHGKVTRAEMSVAWSEICADYGFDFWLFTSAMGGEGKSKEEEQGRQESILKTLRTIPHLDHLYLTGGDGYSSHQRPDRMFDALADFSVEARKVHPDLGIWTSNQGADAEQNNWFFDYLQQEEPDWLTGIVHGAWNRILPSEQRARTPKQYPIRRYPDIGHCVRGQYTVPEWDRAYARTLDREPFAPRPRGAANIHNLFDEYCDGFVTYSDGIGDDVNKFVWTALGWDPDRPLDDIMLDYARFFFGPDIAEEVRRGLYQFEKNFDEPMHLCEGIQENYQRWKTLEAQADDALRGNWRFQSCLMRATFDAYTQRRLLKDMALEKRALALLRDAPRLGVEVAIARARAILAESDQERKADPSRERLLAFGAKLFESIGAQLDVAHYHAASEERGAILEFLDNPMNNRRWMEDEFDAILSGRYSATVPKDPVEGDVRLARLDRLVNWENPGPGGFYDDLGYPWKQPHLVKQKTRWEDPGSIESPREGHGRFHDNAERLSWLDVSEALCGTPLLMRYEGLDPKAHYRLRVTYLGRYGATIHLTADDQYRIHDSYGHTRRGVRYNTKGDSASVIQVDEGTQLPPVVPLEFVIPRETTQDGILELRWDRDTGRGIQIAEVWLIKDQ
jgi:hypothetical protein